VAKKAADNVDAHPLEEYDLQIEEKTASPKKYMKMRSTKKYQCYIRSLKP